MDSLHDEGRTAPAGRLSQTLAGSRLPYLEGALDNPAFTPAHLLLLLRSPAVTPALIARIVQTRTWLRSANVKAEIATHPKTPREKDSTRTTPGCSRQPSKRVGRSASA